MDDIVTVNNIKRAWRFLLDNIDYPVDWQYIREYNASIGEGLVPRRGRLREYGVRIGGTGWVPEIPAVESSQERVRGILEESEGEATAMLLFGAVTRGQWFSDGNKRTALMVANHQLIHDASASSRSLPKTRRSSSLCSCATTRRATTPGSPIGSHRTPSAMCPAG